MDPVVFEKEDTIAWLILNRPKKRNALSLELMADFQTKLERIDQDRSIKVIIIRGNGTAFCAGHDLTEMAGDQFDIHHFRNIFSTCSKLMQRLHDMPQTVIAQVHGIATAAGCQLVAACDLAIAESGAQFATPGVKIGLFCSTPMVPLSRIIGRRRALDMLLTGRFISAHEAERFGLVNRVVEPDDLTSQARQYAMEISRSSLFTLEFGKKAFYSQIDEHEKTAYGYAKEAIAINCLAEDAREGMTAFLSKRTPRWKDR